MLAVIFCNQSNRYQIKKWIIHLMKQCCKVTFNFGFRGGGGGGAYSQTADIHSDNRPIYSRAMVTKTFIQFCNAQNLYEVLKITFEQFQRNNVDAISS